MHCTDHAEFRIGDFPIFVFLSGCFVDGCAQLFRLVERYMSRNIGRLF